MALRLMKAVALVLALGMVLMLAATTGSAFAHEIQHATHHNPRMHATGICAWMCATASSIVTPIFESPASTVLQEFVLSKDSQACSIIFERRYRARAPPALL